MTYFPGDFILNIYCTILQVMMKLFGPGRKKTLLFVIRDKIPVVGLKESIPIIYVVHLHAWVMIFVFIYFVPCYI